MAIVNKNPTIYLGDREAELVAEEIESRGGETAVSTVIQECIRDSLGDDT